MKIIFTTICFTFILSALLGSNDRTKAKVLNIVGNLPEVKTFIHNSQKQKPKLIIAGEPNSKNKYFWVKVGLSNMGIFRTMYNFYVDPKTTDVCYLDNMVDDGDKSSAVLTLKEWRHWRTHPNFNKMHEYKNGKLIAL